MKKILNLTAVLAALTLSGCALLVDREFLVLSVSPKVPAAEGAVNFTVTKNDNTRIALKVRHLAFPEKLTPPAGSYVVWTRADKDAPFQNIGSLLVDRDLLGSLETETPLHRFELFITAEPMGQAQKPSGDSLLWTSYDRKGATATQ